MGIFSWFTGNSKRKQLKRKPSMARQSRLELEPLEARCVPTATTYYASAPVVTGTTVTQTLSFPSLQPTTLYGIFQQFNNSLGTLNSITITQDGTISSDIQVENLSATSSANIEGTVQGTLGLSLTQTNTPISSVSPDALAGTYLAAANPSFVFPDFSFSNPTGTDFGWQNASAQNSVTLTNAQLSAFIGNGTVSLTELDQATSNAQSLAGNGSNGGNIDFYAASKAYDTVTIVYNYTPSADLSITKVASPTSVAVGNSFTYTLTVTNNGPDTANQVVVTDPLPTNATFLGDSGSGWTFSDVNGVVTADLTSPLANQASASFTITESAPTPGTITNTATVSSVTPDPNLGNNTATAIVNVYQPTDLTITKVANPDPVLTNGTLTYTLTVINDGAAAASQVSVTDPLPAGTTYVTGSGTGWTFTDNRNVITANLSGTLAADTTSTFTIIVTAPSVPGTITNTATVATTTPETNYNNNSASVTTQVIQPADVSIVKTANPNPVEVSSDLTYTITVGNAGPAVANNVVVTDPLPTNTTFVSEAGSGWTFSNSIANGVTTITADLIGALAVNASSTFTIVVQAPPTPGTVTNTATVTSSTPDVNLANNTSTVTTQVVQTDDLAITKTANVSTVQVGGQVTYTITVSNLQGATANGVVVTDELPAGTTFISGIGPGWTITDNNNVVTAITSSLPVNVSSFFTITVQAPLVAGTITNTATVTSSTPDSNPNNNTASVTVLVINPPGTTYPQNLPPAEFGTIPIISKVQLMGGTLPAGEAALASQIVSVYLTLTGASPSATTVTNLITQIDAGRTTMQGLVGQLWLSTYHLTQEITQLYQTFLDRNPTSSELTSAINQMKAGASELTIATNLLTSQEFINDNPGPLSLVAAISADVLGQVPSLSSLELSAQSLGTESWTTYVQQALSSSQAIAILVTNAYQAILQVPPTPAQLQSWSTQLENGQITPDHFMQQLLASATFGQLAYQNSK